MAEYVFGDLLESQNLFSGDRRQPPCTDKRVRVRECVVASFFPFVLCFAIADSLVVFFDFRFNSVFSRSCKSIEAFSLTANRGSMTPVFVSISSSLLRNSFIFRTPDLYHPLVDPCRSWHAIHNGVVAVVVVVNFFFLFFGSVGVLGSRVSFIPLFRSRGFRIDKQGYEDSPPLRYFTQQFRNELKNYKAFSSTVFCWNLTHTIVVTSVLWQLDL